MFIIIINQTVRFMLSIVTKWRTWISIYQSVAISSQVSVFW